MARIKVQTSRGRKTCGYQWDTTEACSCLRWTNDGGPERDCEKCESSGRNPITKTCGLKKAEHFEMHSRLAGIDLGEETPADHTFETGTYACEKCSNTIAIGSQYKSVAIKTGPRSSRTRRRCGECPTWKPSELTSSFYRQVVWGAQEDFVAPDAPDTAEDAGSVLEQLAAAVQEAGETMREALEQFEESIGNMSDAFPGGSYMIDELQDRHDELEGQIEECESWEGESYSGTEADEDSDEEEQDSAESELADWWSEQVDEAETVVSACDPG